MPHLEILLVDDDPLIRHVLADELEEAGHFVTPVVGGEAALEAIRDAGGYDIVLIDYTMPEMSGAELASHILARDPKARLAILTGHASLPEPPPPCPVLTKGVRVSELIKAVEAIAAGRDAVLSHDATTARVDLLRDQIATKPTVGGVRSGMGATFEAPEEGVPDAFASLLERLPEK